MSMPQIPEEKHRPNLCEVIIDIFKSVALEETAISHIINAEGEKNQSLIKRFECGCNKITFCEINESFKQTEKTLNTIIMKEWLLLRKLETALEISSRLEPCNKKTPPFCECVMEQIIMTNNLPPECAINPCQNECPPPECYSDNCHKKCTKKDCFYKEKNNRQ